MDENQENEVMHEEQENAATNENQENEVINENQEMSLTTSEEVIAKPKKKKGSYITGAIGAILGGLVASIPWILTYIYGNMIVAVLATLIAGGAYLGYKIFKGRIGKGFPVILTIVSLLVVTVVTTVICPTILMMQQGFTITLDNLLGLYSDNQAKIRTAIFEDLAISLLFTIIGIAALVKSISVQIKNGANGKQVKFNTQAVYEEVKRELKEQSEAVKKACLTLNCMNKENTAEKQEILNELEMTYGMEHKKAKQYFSTCVAYKLLKKQKGKYYYDEANELTKIEKVTNPNNRRTSLKAAIIIVIIAIIVGVVAGYLTTNVNTEYTVPNSNIELEIDNTQVLYGTAEEITAAFDATSAEYYDFIIKDKEADKYDIYGQLIPKTQYEGYEFDEIIKADRDYYAQYIGEDATSEVMDKQLGNNTLKAYNYTYTGNDKNEYKAVIYLYEEEENYLWINIYADMDVEYTQIDTLIDNLIK